MRADSSMRDRVENGQGMLVVSLFALGASWFWYQLTSAPSLWWGISGVLVLGSVLYVARSVQLILSGMSGFGRNFHEEREPPDLPPGDESYDLDAAISNEASHVWGGPGVLFASGVLATAFRLFPGMMSPDGIPDPEFVPYEILVLWIFIAGLGTVAWTSVVLVMMKTGADRWATFQGSGSGSGHRCGNSSPSVSSWCSSQPRSGSPDEHRPARTCCETRGAATA